MCRRCPISSGVLAATVFAWPDGLGIAQAPFVALLVVLVPALLMVSRIRFRSFGALIVQPRRSSVGLLQFAILVAAIAVQPQLVLFLLAYAYLVSGPIGYVVGRAQRASGRQDEQARDAADLKTASTG